MRQESIKDNLVVTWRDERQGIVSLTDLTLLPAVLAHYGLPQQKPAVPLEVENDNFKLTCSGGSAPYLVTIFRKPQGLVQEAAWQYVAETQMAKVVFENDELGVHFLDEDKFVPFSRLQFDTKSGFTIT